MFECRTECKNKTIMSAIKESRHKSPLNVRVEPTEPSARTKTIMSAIKELLTKLLPSLPTWYVLLLVDLLLLLLLLPASAPLIPSIIYFFSQKLISNHHLRRSYSSRFYTKIVIPVTEMSILPAFMMSDKNTSCYFDANQFAATRGLMPEGFVPSPDDVIIGRGKKIVAHNVRFRAIIESELNEYSSAESKALKSSILVRVLAFVREVRGGSFVKPDTKNGRWISVEDGLARTTIAQAFRDALHTTYRSSKRFKRRRRKQGNTSLTSEETDDASDDGASINSGPQGLTLVSALECAKSAAESKRARTGLVGSSCGSAATSRLHDILKLMDLNESFSLPSLPAELFPQYQEDDLFSPSLFTVFDDGPCPSSHVVKPLPIATPVLPLSTFQENGNGHISDYVDDDDDDDDDDDTLSMLDILDVSAIRAAFLGAP